MNGNQGLIVAIVVGAALLLVGGVVGYLFLAESDDSDIGGAKMPEVTSDPGLAPRRDNPAPISATPFDASQDVAHGIVNEKAAGGPVLEGIVKDPAGKPLPGAEVHVLLDVSPVRTRQQEGELLVSVKTGKTGTFRIDGLVRGDIYVLRAAHTEFATERRKVAPDEPSTLRHVIRMENGGGFFGTVTSIDGGPIAGAQVSVYDMMHQAMDPESLVERTAKTNADGKYRIAHLAKGLKKVVVRKDGYASDGVGTLDLARRNAEEAVDFSLNPGFAIGGTVVNAITSEPIPGARLVARPSTHIGRKPGEQAKIAHQEIVRRAFLMESTLADAEGHFRLGGLMDARYRVMAFADGYQPSTYGHEAAAGAEGVSIQLRPNARIVGIVVDAETNEPVQNFVLGLVRTPEATVIPANLRQRYEDPKGAFEYLNARPGRVHLLASAEGYALSPSDPITVQPAERVEGVVIRLNRGASIKGRVVDTGGAPVAGARITATPGKKSDGASVMFIDFITSQLRVPTKPAVTDDNGQFVVSNLRAGRYVLKAEHAKFAEGQSTDVECANRGEVEVPDIVLPEGATIRATVTTEGVPDPSASVMISSADMQRNFFNRRFPTDAKGRIEASGIPAGTYRVTVAVRAGQPSFKDILPLSNGAGSRTQQVVTVVPGQVIDIDL